MFVEEGSALKLNGTLIPLVSLSPEGWGVGVLPDISHRSICHPKGMISEPFLSKNGAVDKTRNTEHSGTRNKN